MRPEDEIRLRHMLDAETEALEFLADRNLDDLANDRKLALALVKEIEIIGEAARLVPNDVTTRHHQVPWGDMSALRNIVAHEYDRVDLSIIWETVHNDLPPLLPLLREVLLEEEI